MLLIILREIKYLFCIQQEQYVLSTLNSTMLFETLCSGKNCAEKNIK